VLRANNREACLVIKMDDMLVTGVTVDGWQDGVCLLQESGTISDKTKAMNWKNPEILLIRSKQEEVSSGFFCLFLDRKGVYSSYALIATGCAKKNHSSRCSACTTSNGSSSISPPENTDHDAQ